MKKDQFEERYKDALARLEKATYGYYQILRPDISADEKRKLIDEYEESRLALNAIQEEKRWQNCIDQKAFS